MSNMRALSRYRVLREQQACRLMQADAAARDRARLASETAAAALASAESDRSLGEQRYYRDLACTARVTIDVLYRGHDELARLGAAVEGASRLAEAASATLAHCESKLLRSGAEYRARSREVRKVHLLQDKLEDAVRSHMELIDELDAEEQNSVRHMNKPGGRSEWP
jgi:hypothetical protein